MFRILVAEDDAALRQMFCRVLSRSGFDPIPAADGQEALELLDRDEFITYPRSFLEFLFDMQDSFGFVTK